MLFRSTWVSKRPSKPNLPSVPKPSKLLLQQGFSEPCLIISRQKHRHGSNQTTRYKHLNIKNTSFNQACSYSSTKAYSKQMHVHMNAFLTSLHHNTYSWSYHMHVHGISNKEMKLSPNLTCKGQTTNKHGSRDS